MANCKMVSYQPQPDGGAALCFQDVDPAVLANDVAAFFSGQGYKFEGGSPMRGKYGTGSDLLRILFGAFAKRYQFDFVIEPQPPHVWLRLNKGISGAMGGVIGYARMKKELDRILTAMQAFFA